MALLHGGAAGRVETFRVTLGRSSLDDVCDRATRLLVQPGARLVIDIVGFDYFDEASLDRLAELSVRSAGRIEVQGLDRYATHVLGTGVPHQLGSGEAERAVAQLTAVAVVTAVHEGRPLSDDEWEAALALGRDSDRPIVAVDLVGLTELSAAQVLALAELSADLDRTARRLFLLNAGPIVARQLKSAALNGGLWASTGELDPV